MQIKDTRQDSCPKLPTGHTFDENCIYSTCQPSNNVTIHKSHSVCVYTCMLISVDYIIIRKFLFYFLILNNHSWSRAGQKCTLGRIWPAGRGLERPYETVSWFVDYAGLLVIQSAICLADLNIDQKALQRCWWSIFLLPVIRVSSYFITFRKWREADRDK